MACTEEITLVGYDGSGKSTLMTVALKIEKKKKKSYPLPPNAECLPKKVISLKKKNKPTL